VTRTIGRGRLTLIFCVALFCGIVIVESLNQAAFTGDTLIGAVIYALRRPDPWPGTFGHHEFFHACTLLAAICHHVAIYFALLS